MSKPSLFACIIYHASKYVTYGLRKLRRWKFGDKQNEKYNTARLTVTILLTRVFNYNFKRKQYC